MELGECVPMREVSLFKKVLYMRRCFNGLGAKLFFFVHTWAQSNMLLSYV